MSTTYHDVDNSDNNSPANPDNVGYPQVDLKEKYSDKWHEMQYWHGDNPQYHFMQWVLYWTEEGREQRGEYVDWLNEVGTA